MTVRHDGAERRPRWQPRSSLAAREMRVGPSGSGCRVRSQTAPELLGSRARVVSVRGKGGPGACQVRVEKTNASEPLMMCRKRRDVIETRLQSVVWDRAWGQPAYCPGGGRHEGGVSSTTGSRAERGNLSPRCQGRTSSGRPTRGRVPMRGTGTDRLVVAMKPGNAGGAKESGCPALGTSQPVMGGARA